MKTAHSDRIIITMERFSSCLMFTTMDATHSYSTRLYVTAEGVASWLASDHRSSYIEQDLNHFIMFSYSSRDRVRISFYWLHQDYQGLSGYRQDCVLPTIVLREALAMPEDAVIRYLGIKEERVSQSRIVLSDTAHYRVAQMSPEERRAFVRCLSGHFYWGRENTINVYADFGKDFYFAEEGGINGGICYSRSTVLGKDGDTYFKTIYSVHT